MNGFAEGGLGALMGGAVGGLIGGIDATSNGRNFWTGDLNKPILIPADPISAAPVVGKTEITAPESITHNNLVASNASVETGLQQAVDPQLLVEQKIVSGGWPEGKGTYSVYYGIDPTTGQVRYIGITSRQPALRFQEHLSSGTAKAGLQYRTIGVKGNLSRTQARILEQTLINYYGLGKNGGSLVNIINSISQKKWGDFTITITNSGW